MKKIIALVAFCCLISTPALADPFSAYQIGGSFDLAAVNAIPSVENTPLLGVLTSGSHAGKMIAVSTEGFGPHTSNVFLETGVGTREFSAVGSLAAGFSPSFGPSFLEVSPDGSQIVIGNNISGTFSVFNAQNFADGTDLTGASHFVTTSFLSSAAWLSGSEIALNIADSAFPPLNEVVVYDLNTSSSTTVAFRNSNFSTDTEVDPDGNLYFGIGFGAGTGTVRKFNGDEIRNIINGEVGSLALDWDMLADPDIEDFLQHASAISINFDKDGNNVIISGGDSTDGVLIYNIATGDSKLFFDDDAVFPAGNSLSSLVNPITSEIYVYDSGFQFGSGITQILVITVPEPTTWVMLAMVFVIGGIYFYRKREAFRVESKAVAA